MAVLFGTRKGSARSKEQRDFFPSVVHLGQAHQTEHKIGVRPEKEIPASKLGALCVWVSARVQVHEICGVLFLLKRKIHAVL